ncbi:hypothetical protein RR48_13480 [Papilio machaon]|uniref:Uncharacterized protein n=1 Tax=Papilio machaon TaxID=76193 RepID=A0A194RA77_PAPMA|nr:hypothetical protein RR48_13480 [Papilio machaon]
MKKSSIYKDFYPKSSSFLSFLCDENGTCEAKTVTDDLCNDDCYEDFDVKLYNEGTIVTEHPLEPSTKSYQGKLYDLKESTRKLLCLLDKILMFEPQITEGQIANETLENKSNYKNRLKPIQPHLMAATLVNKIARPEEGKRYLNLNSRIIFDIKQAFKKCGNHLNAETVEMLRAILDRLEPQFAQNLSVSFYRKTNDKGVVIQTLLNLIKHGSEMPLEEALLNLELLSNWSKHENGKEELKSYRPELLLVLKSILRVYDHSQINIFATTLLNNVVSKSMIKGNNFGVTNIVVVTSTATEQLTAQSDLQLTNQTPIMHLQFVKTDCALYISHGPMTWKFAN